MNIRNQSEWQDHKYLIGYWLLNCNRFLNYWLVDIRQNQIRIHKQRGNPDPNHSTPHHTDTATQNRVIREERERATWAIHFSVRPHTISITNHLRPFPHPFLCKHHHHIDHHHINSRQTQRGHKRPSVVVQGYQLHQRMSTVTPKQRGERHCHSRHESTATASIRSIVLI